MTFRHFLRNYCKFTEFLKRIYVIKLVRSLSVCTSVHHVFSPSITFLAVISVSVCLSVCHIFSFLHIFSLLSHFLVFVISQNRNQLFMFMHPGKNGGIQEGSFSVLRWFSISNVRNPYQSPDFLALWTKSNLEVEIFLKFFLCWIFVYISCRLNLSWLFERVTPKRDGGINCGSRY